MTWRALINEEMAFTGETWDDVVGCTLDDAALDDETPLAFAECLKEGAGFTLWTRNRVYFPVEFEEHGLYVQSAPRNPCDEATWLWAGRGA